jgi:hypothetical protein
MSQSLSPKGKKVFDYFVANPTANASKVAAKFKMSMSNVYKLKTSANSIKATAQKIKPARLLPEIPPEPKTSWQKIVKEVEETTNVDKTLDARAEMYGKFKDGAALMQAIKRTMAAHASKHDKTFADDQWEALEMIVHKMGRIVNGDPDVVDHWVDIAGYATLIADRLEGNAR